MLTTTTIHVAEWNKNSSHQNQSCLKNVKLYNSKYVSLFALWLFHVTHTLIVHVCQNTTTTPTHKLLNHSGVKYKPIKWIAILKLLALIGCRGCQSVVQYIEDTCWFRWKLEFYFTCGQKIYFFWPQVK